MTTLVGELKNLIGSHMTKMQRSIDECLVKINDIDERMKNLEGDFEVLVSRCGISEEEFFKIGKTYYFKNVSNMKRIVCKNVYWKMLKLIEYCYTYYPYYGNFNKTFNYNDCGFSVYLRCEFNKDMYSNGYIFYDCVFNINIMIEKI